jgi:hypothetical protein
MRPNANRRIATRRNTTRSTWVQLSIGASVLLPPLALGAAFYAMLAPAADDDTAAVRVPAAVPDPHQQAAPVAAPATDAALPAIAGAPPSRLAADDTEGDRPLAKGGPVQVAVVPSGAVVTSAAASSGAVTSATARSGAAAMPAPDTPAAPKHPLHRHAPRPQPDPFTLRGWLQDIGILARDGNSTPADGHRQ